MNGFCIFLLAAVVAVLVLEVLSRIAYGRAAIDTFAELLLRSAGKHIEIKEDAHGIAERLERLRRQGETR